MGYFIKYLPLRKSSPAWKVQFVSYKKIDIKSNSCAQKPKREWDIPRPRWQSLGFNFLPYQLIKDRSLNGVRLDGLDAIR